MVVSALIRRVHQKGGSATVVNKGAAEAGAILLICMERGVFVSILERVLGPEHAYRWIRVGPESAVEPEPYLVRRRAYDPDIWLIELDIVHAERFAAETMGDR